MHDVERVLEEYSDTWNLEADKQCLLALEGVIQRVKGRMHDTGEQIERLVAHVLDTDLAISNTHNAFTALSYQQFIENRVEEERVEVQEDVVSEDEVEKDPFEYFQAAFDASIKTMDLIDPSNDITTPYLIQDGALPPLLGSKEFVSSLPDEQPETMNEATVPGSRVQSASPTSRYSQASLHSDYPSYAPNRAVPHAPAAPKPPSPAASPEPKPMNPLADMIQGAFKTRSKVRSAIGSDNEEEGTRVFPTSPLHRPLIHTDMSEESAFQRAKHLSIDPLALLPGAKPPKKQSDAMISPRGLRSQSSIQSPRLQIFDDDAASDLFGDEASPVFVPKQPLTAVAAATASKLFESDEDSDSLFAAPVEPVVPPSVQQQSSPVSESKLKETAASKGPTLFDSDDDSLFADAKEPVSSPIPTSAPKPVSESKRMPSPAETQTKTETEAAVKTPISPMEKKAVANTLFSDDSDTDSLFADREEPVLSQATAPKELLPESSLSPLLISSEAQVQAKTPMQSPLEEKAVASALFSDNSDDDVFPVRKESTAPVKKHTLFSSDDDDDFISKLRRPSKKTVFEDSDPDIDAFSPAVRTRSPSRSFPGVTNTDPPIDEGQKESPVTKDSTEEEEVPKPLFSDDSDDDVFKDAPESLPNSPIEKLLAASPTEERTLSAPALQDLVRSKQALFSESDDDDDVFESKPSNTNAVAHESRISSIASRFESLSRSPSPDQKTDKQKEKRVPSRSRSPLQDRLATFEAKEQSQRLSPSKSGKSTSRSPSPLGSRVAAFEAKTEVKKEEKPAPKRSPSPAKHKFAATMNADAFLRGMGGGPAPKKEPAPAAASASKTMGVASLKARMQIDPTRLMGQKPTKLTSAASAPVHGKKTGKIEHSVLSRPTIRGARRRPRGLSQKSLKDPSLKVLEKPSLKHIFVDKTSEVREAAKAVPATDTKEAAQITADDLMQKVEDHTPVSGAGNKEPDAMGAVDAVEVESPLQMDEPVESSGSDEDLGSLVPETQSRKTETKTGTKKLDLFGDDDDDDDMFGDDGPTFDTNVSKPGLFGDEKDSFF